MGFSVYFAHAFLAGFAFLFGSCIGSFVNVLIYRVPRKISFISGRSCCPSCGAQIAALHLIPLAGYLILRGKCKGCQTGIPVRYPLVELCCGLLCVLVSIHYGFGLTAFVVFLITSLLVATFMVDLDTMTIPNGFVIALAPLAVLSAFLFPEISIGSRVIGFFCVSVPMFLTAVAITGSFGLGDVKLISVCGFMLGWQYTLLAAFIAVMLGGGAALILLAAKRVKRDSHIPFGPALCIGCFCALLWGDLILTWYTGMF